MKNDFKLTSDQQRLVEDNLHLIRWTIFTYIDIDESVCGLGYDDLFQEGALALCKAASSFEKGNIQFSTYAITVIRNHLLDCCRSVQTRRRQLPTVSVEAMPSGEGPPGLAADDGIDALLSKITADALLAKFKRKYKGVARLGMEALEWKTKGLTGTDIARLYDTKPNYIGSCISRAAAKLRKEPEAAAYFSTCVEDEAHGS